MGSFYLKSFSTCHGQWDCFSYMSQFLTNSAIQSAIVIWNPAVHQLNTVLLEGPTQLPLEQAQQIKEKAEVGETESPGGKNNIYWALALRTCHAFSGASEFLWKSRFREESWCGPWVSAFLIHRILVAKELYWVSLIDALISKWNSYNHFKDGESEVVRVLW